MLNFGKIVVEEGEEGGLRAGRSFDAEEGKGGDLPLPFDRVKKKILKPKAGPFADCGRLGALEMGVAEAWGGGVLGGEGGELAEDVQELVEEELKRFLHLDQIGVVSGKGRGGAEVDDPFRIGALVAESVDMGHYIVLAFFFMAEDGVEVDGFGVGLQLLDLPVGDRKAEFLLPFGERDPEAAENDGFEARRKKGRHLRAYVARREGADVSVFWARCHFLSIEQGLQLREEVLQLPLLLFAGLAKGVFQHFAGPF